MLDGRTPFYNKNRKYMFHCIVHVRPTFPPHFSAPAKHLLFRLLEPDPARRFGSGEKGAREIMEHEFFRCEGMRAKYRSIVKECAAKSIHQRAHSSLCHHQFTATSTSSGCTSGR